MGRSALQRFKLGSQKHKLLGDIVMKFARDAAAFLLLSPNQLAAHAGERLFGQLALGYIDAGTDIALKSAIGAKSGNTNIQHPSILSIGTPEAIFHLEVLPPIESVDVGFQTVCGIVGVDTIHPASPHFLPERVP